MLFSLLYHIACVLVRSHATCSPLGFEGCVGCSDGGAVAAFDDEGGGDGRLDDVGAGCFCDLFGSQVVLSERPQGDGSLFLIDNHGVVFICDWGDSGFRPRADDASAVPFLVVVVVAVDEVVNVHIEAISEQVPAIGERGCGLDGDVCAVGEGDGVSRGAAVAVARVVLRVGRVFWWLLWWCWCVRACLVEGFSIPRAWPCFLMVVWRFSGGCEVACE